ncbi:MAG: hypothetical protein RL386_2101, partial [Bacteroidota bacterium]
MFYGYRIKAVFERLDAPCQIVWSVARKNRAVGLQDNGAFVVTSIHPMDCHSAFGFPCGNYRFVDVPAVHTFSPEFRQKCRMNIHHTALIRKHKKFGYFPHKTCKGNEINRIRPQQGQDDALRRKTPFVQYNG